jgi:hypothetical protein
MKFSYRRYQDGDAPAINELYYQVTGRRRTVQQHAWQWLESPAGESEMWLIQAELEDGSLKLIGHHGVMAEEFSHRGAPIRVGKTENTMVLPEFRDKILYPRFEKTFLKQYEGKFHALFSTTGPEPAIRLREAMGYKFNHEWKAHYFGKEPGLSASLVLDRLLPRNPLHLTQMLSSAAPCLIDRTHIQVLEPNDPSFDFDDFWAKVAPGYGVTPKRTRANLNWRFWSNPYHSHITVKLSGTERGTCICVVSCRSRRCMFVNDVFTDKPENTRYFLDHLYNWARRVSGVTCLQCHSTDENLQLLSGRSNSQTPWAESVFNLVRRQTGSGKMPRKITPQGQDVGLSDASDWYVTPFYFEGR